MFERVELGDPGRVGDQGAGRGAAAGADRNAVVPGVLADVGDHEEVRGEAHRTDDLHLGLEPLDHLVGQRRAVPPLQADRALLAQPRLLGLALGHVELRHLVDVGEHVVVRLDALGDQQRVVAALGEFGEQPAHLGGGLDVVAGAVEPEAVRVVLVLAHADAQQGVVGVGLALVHVVRVVGDQRPDAELLGDAQQVLADVALQVQPVVHQFEEVVVLPEDVLVVGRRP